jgi:hypothetical protein
MRESDGIINKDKIEVIPFYRQDPHATNFSKNQKL